MDTEKDRQVRNGTQSVFWIVLAAAFLCTALVFCLLKGSGTNAASEEGSAIVDGEGYWRSVEELLEGFRRGREADPKIARLFELQEAAGFENGEAIYLPARLPEGYSLRKISMTTYGIHIHFHYQNPEGGKLDFVWNISGNGKAFLENAIGLMGLKQIDGLTDIWGHETVDERGTRIYSVYFESNGFEFQINVPKEDFAAMCEEGTIPVKAYPPQGAGETGEHTQDAGGPTSLENYTTSVAYVNGEVYGRMTADCLNLEMLSFVWHIPVLKFDTMDDFIRFKETYQDISLNLGYNEMPSFNEVTTSYDERFFASHTVILAYVPSGSASFRYEIRDISAEKGELCMYVIETGRPETLSPDGAAWFVMAEVLDSEIADIVWFDAVLDHEE